MIQFIASTPATGDKVIVVQGGALTLRIDRVPQDREYTMQDVREQAQELVNVLNKHYRGQPTTGL